LPAEPFVNAQPRHQQQAQLEQLSSVAAGARYLKNKCSRSDLPSDDAIDRAAWNVGKKRMGNIDYATLTSAARKCISNCSRTVRRKPPNAASLIASWRLY
jgi:hypothetical protein